MIENAIQQTFMLTSRIQINSKHQKMKLISPCDNLSNSDLYLMKIALFCQMNFYSNTLYLNVLVYTILIACSAFYFPQYLLQEQQQSLPYIAFFHLYGYFTTHGPHDVTLWLHMRYWQLQQYGRMKFWHRYIVLSSLTHCLQLRFSGSVSSGTSFLKANALSFSIPISSSFSWPNAIK